MAKQIGMILVAASIIFLIAGIWIGKGFGITANVVKQPEMGIVDYLQASSFSLFVVFLTAGLVFLFRVRPGNS
jgi:hypothetical protein